MNVLPPLGLSDHFAILACFDLEQEGSPRKVRIIFSPHDWDCMNDKSIEENWKYFKDMVDLFIQNEVPLKQVKRLSKPWVTKGTIKLITAKRKAWQTWKYSASPEHYEKYRNAREL